MTFETLKVQVGDAVLFVEISAPPMNLLGPALVRDLVSLIQETEADDTARVLVFKSADRATEIFRWLLPVRYAAPIPLRSFC